MALRYRETLLTAMIQAVLDAVVTGTGTARLRIYNGTRPARPETAITSQTLLADIPLGAANDLATAIATIGTGSGAGTATFDTTGESAAAAATGTATWFRVLDQAGNAVLDGDVGTSGSDMNMTSVSITSGLTVQLTAPSTITISGY